MANITMTTHTPEVQTEEIKEVITNFNIAPANGLDVLREKAESIQEKCSDTLLHTVDLTTLALYCNANGKTLAKYRNSKSEPVREKTFSDYAFSQFCSKIGVPAQYLEKCMRVGYSDLAEENLNTWVNDYDKPLFFREYENKVRGVLSARYSPFDTPQILDVLETATRGLNLKVKGFLMNEERFHARLIQTEQMHVDGEDLFGGIQIDSSDVGRSALTVNFFIFKQICTNGLCVSKGNGNLFTQKHINITADEFYKELSTSVKLIPDLVAEYESTIKRAMLSRSLMTVGKEDISSIVRRGLDLPKEDRDKAIQELIERLKAKTKLNDEGVEKVLRVADDKYGFSNWGVVNAITEVAQDFTLEKRIDLERSAANMLRAV